MFFFYAFLFVYVFVCVCMSVCVSHCVEARGHLSWIDFFFLKPVLCICVCEVHIHSITKCILLYILCFLSFLFLSTEIWTQCLYILDKNNSVMKLYSWFFLLFNFEAGLTELFRVVLDSSVDLMGLKPAILFPQPPKWWRLQMCVTNADCFLGCESLHMFAKSLMPVAFLSTLSFIPCF